MAFAACITITRKGETMDFEAQDIENQKFLDNSLKGRKLTADTFLISIRGRWVSGVITLDQFSGDYVDSGDGWIIVGNC